MANFKQLNINRITKIWIARILICIVLFFNIQCALAFLIIPEQYISSFSLNGVSGRIVIQGTGLLFIMWNIPYIIAFINPIKYRLSLHESIVMQAIGFFGEVTIALLNHNLPVNLSESIIRFSIFDGTGLFLLILAAGVSRYPILGK